MRIVIAPGVAALLALLTLPMAACSHKDSAAANTVSQRSVPSSQPEAEHVATPAKAEPGPVAPISTSRIPFIEGLTTVSAVSDANGDYESFGAIESISPDRYRVIVSAELRDENGGKPREVSVPRYVRIEDQRRAHVMRHYFHTGDAQQFSGTTPGFSAEMVNELHSAGTSRLTFVEVGEMFGVSNVERTLKGSVTRVEAQPVAMAVIVNDKPMLLPAIHAKGTLSDQDSSDGFDFYILDDPDNPLLLKKSGPDFASTVIRIEFPEPAGIRKRFEVKLKAHEPVDVYGIYFSFNRADIRPESEPVLKEIAAVMATNPTWHLRIDGHTDGIGNIAANQTLSERRAAAVKNALVSRYGIGADRLATGGHGASSPLDRNDTPEGRARNRRVELRRE